MSRSNYCRTHHHVGGPAGVMAAADVKLAIMPAGNFAPRRAFLFALELPSLLLGPCVFDRAPQWPSLPACGDRDP